MRDDMPHTQQLDHSLREARMSEECDKTISTSDHTREEEKAMSEALRRCFGGDV